MTVNNSFEHFRSRVGLNPLPPNIKTHEGMYPSPFDYPKQALLGLPTDLPHPAHKDFIPQCARFINESIRSSGGGVFVLCTSYSMLRKLAEIATHQLGDQFPIFYQGQMGRFQLLDRFLNTPNSVLFGADSFWEGVSVQGENLRMVIIPRLPFRVPSEPVEQARHELMEAKGKNPFTEYSLPQAALKLRQGFGRLIRTQTDRGAVLILDPRISQKWYGRIFLRSLPTMKQHRGRSIDILHTLQLFFSQIESEKD
jgi:ATP-dependent DNA helicase DinG